MREFRLYARVIHWWCAAQESPEVSALGRDESIIRDRREKRLRRKLFENGERDEIARRVYGREREKNKRRAREIKTGTAMLRGG